jgi:hypothetical protein
MQAICSGVLQDTPPPPPPPALLKNGADFVSSLHAVATADINFPGNTSSFVYEG